MIIESLLDTDLYKFTMMQAVLHQFPGAQVEYKFRCRTPGVQLAPYVHEIHDELRHLCSLRFSDDELAYMRGMRFIKSDFIDFLGLFAQGEPLTAAAGHFIHVYVDRETRRPVAVPDALRNVLQALVMPG